MKKLLKLSATALIIAGANMLLSQSALACQDSGSGRCGNQGYSGNTYNGGYYGYGNYGGGYNGPIYRTPYLAILVDKNDKFYFNKSIHVSPYPNVTQNDWQDIERKSLMICEFDKKSPCTFLTSVINTGCIAYLKTPATLYSEPANTCAEAKQAINNRCMARYNDPKICKGIKTKKP